MIDALVKPNRTDFFASYAATTAARRLDGRPLAGSLSPFEAIAARKRARASALAWLAATYPAAFGADAKPLALGVGRLVWPRAKLAGITRRALNDALKRHTGSAKYLGGLAAGGAMRCDLEGNTIEPVSAEHREIALARKAELVRRATARKAELTQRAPIQVRTTGDRSGRIRARS